MRLAVYIIVGLALFMMFSFFILGKKSQKGNALGLQDGRLAACGTKPNCVSSETDTDAKHNIDGYQNASISDLETMIKAAGGVVVLSTPDYISAEFRSNIFGFVDDFEARQDGNNIQIRAASRVGYSDRGVNRARVESLRASLNAPN